MIMKRCAAVLLLVTGGCGLGGYTPMQFEPQGEALIATGATDAGTLALFQQAMERHPNTRVLVLQNVDGSTDDVVNLQLADAVRRAGLATLIPADGMAASGGVDLFLAGVQRILEPGACVGVHGWSDSTGTIEATQFPRDDPEHQMYLDYFDRVGAPHAFYWFTLDAAPAAEMHWMTAAEARRFGIATQQVASLSPPRICDER